VIKTFTAKLSEKNQITVPSELRKALNLRAHDRVQFELENGEARVSKAAPVLSLAELKGIVKPPMHGEPIDIERAIYDAQQEMAEKIIRDIGET
jgi:AbrB family looped-hinge helix DNA binding protein